MRPAPVLCSDCRVTPNARWDSRYVLCSRCRETYDRDWAPRDIEVSRYVSARTYTFPLPQLTNEWHGLMLNGVDEADRPRFLQWVQERVSRNGVVAINATNKGGVLHLSPDEVEGMALSDETAQVVALGLREYGGIPWHVAASFAFYGVGSDAARFFYNRHINRAGSMSLFVPATRGEAGRNPHAPGQAYECVDHAIEWGRHLGVSPDEAAPLVARSHPYYLTPRSAKGYVRARVDCGDEWQLLLGSLDRRLLPQDVTGPEVAASWLEAGLTLEDARNGWLQMKDSIERALTEASMSAVQAWRSAGFQHYDHTVAWHDLVRTGKASVIQCHDWHAEGVPVEWAAQYLASQEPTSRVG